MLRRIAVLACGLALCVVPLGAIAVAGEGHDMGKEHGRRLLADLDANAARLGISDDTVAKIHAIVDEGTARGENVRAELTEARTALRSLLSTPRPDEAAVMAQARKIGALDTRLLELRLQTLLRVRPLLTDTQIEALHAIREQRLTPVREACHAEISASCADAVSGRETVRCLRAHLDQLSDACRAALVAFRAERAKIAATFRSPWPTAARPKPRVAYLGPRAARPPSSPPRGCHSGRAARGPRAATMRRGERVKRGHRSRRCAPDRRR